MKIFNFKSRKAISTIVGTFFFVIVMVGAFSAFILMMQTNADFLNTQLDITQSEIQKIQGQFTIAAAYDDTGAVGKRLCVSVKNSGSTPLEIADLFIVNKTNNEVRQFDIDFRDAFVPASSIRKILDNQPITLRPGIHDIKVVSTSGITQTTELKVFATSSPDPRFNVTAFVSPISSASGQNVTVGMHVHNRMNTTLINVQADGDPSVEPSEAVAEGFNPSGVRNYTRLDPNEDALFLWEPEFVGGVGSKLNFTVRAKALVEGCTSSSPIRNEDVVQLKVVPGVKRQILASPETFISFPSPFGQTAAANSNQGVFSVVVLNPTDRSVKVAQVAITILNPEDEDLLRGSGLTGIAPTGTAGWSQDKNVIFWKGTSAVTLKPFDMQTFSVFARPSSGIASDAPINTLFFNVYSSFGQFGKDQPFTFGAHVDNTAMVSLYAQNSFSSATQGGSPVYVYEDIPSGSTQTLHFTISNNGSTSVDSSSTNRPYLLINIPPGLRNIADVCSPAPCTGLTSGLVVHNLIEFDDGSMQKPIELNTALAVQTARTYSMTATMPSISVPAHYIITLAANGTAGSSLVGPLSEIILQVCPDNGCP
ncbi:MAG: hypothetical protein FJ356_01725 [Thaumarchaeota archaeon]|nr:hypothetical protein [Nitrososphaerota archaeon]